MYISPNMLLEIWDLATDDFDYTVLAQNEVLIDQHDHSEGKGRQINGGVAIEQASITQTQMAPDSIGSPQLQDDSVGTDQLEDSSVTTDKLAEGSVVAGPIPNGAITAALLDSTIIPLGYVAMWWRPPGSFAVPGGFWEVMDGRPWSQIQNAWGLTTGTIPDMRGLFAQGADLTTSHGPAVGQTGGSSSYSFTHKHMMLGHAHSIPSHAHTINDDGSHIHLWQGGLHMGARTNAFLGGAGIGTHPDGDAYNYPFAQVTMQARDGDWNTNTYYTLYIRNLTSSPNWGQYVPPRGSYPQGAGTGYVTGQTDGIADMDNAGSHNHGGRTEYWSGTTGLATDQTDGGDLGNMTIVPPYCGLVYMMRVR